jgi:secretion/DNA translocation related TadE-like protein
VRSDRGSVTIVTAAILAAVVILAMGAADVARVFVAASRAQTAADAAALAAAQSLVVPGDVTPEDAAAEFAARNGAGLLSCTCDTVTLDALVIVRVPVGPLLLRPDDRIVTAEARAIVDPPEG